mgnify:CR=1 FL=1
MAVDELDAMASDERQWRSEAIKSELWKLGGLGLPVMGTNVLVSCLSVCTCIVFVIFFSNHRFIIAFWHNVGCRRDVSWPFGSRLPGSWCNWHSILQHVVVLYIWHVYGPRHLCIAGVWTER